VGTRAALGILAVLLLAGCASDVPPDRPLESADPVVPPPPPSYGPAECSNLMLFQVVDYAQTDPFLPPGFHARDPQAFLNSPAAFGQAGVLFLALDCQSATSGPLSVAFVGIFVEPPIVEGLEPAPLDFLELVRYTSSSPFESALRDAGWPLLPANVSVVSDVPGLQGSDARARVTDSEGTVVMVAGTVATPDTDLDTPARFWHQGPSGLAYIEYNGHLTPNVGTGVCEVRAGTPLGAFVNAPLGVQTPVGDPTSCLAAKASLDAANTSEPIVVSLQDLVLDATFHQLPGIRAG
jgi:hypothetical protein